MSKYECSRCGYLFNYKSKFIRHLQRKKICKPIKENIEIQEIYNKYFENDSITNKSKYITNIAKYSTNISQYSTKNKDHVTPEISCKFCKKIFKHRSTKYRHEKHFWIAIM